MKIYIKSRKYFRGNLLNNWLRQSEEGILLVVGEELVGLVNLTEEHPGEGAGNLDALLHDVPEVAGDLQSSPCARLLHLLAEGLDVESGAAHGGPGETESNSGRGEGVHLLTGEHGLPHVVGEAALVYLDVGLLIMNNLTTPRPLLSTQQHELNSPP